MSFVGTISKGTVVLPPDIDLPEGSKVRVEPLESGTKPILEKLRKLAGSAKGLPADLAANHDHYLHGASKRQK